jgi:hypothetical protein
MNLSSTVDTSSTCSSCGNFTVILNAYNKSRFLRISLELVVPITSNLFSDFFGGLLTKTKRVWRIALENLGPKSTYSTILSISSRMIIERGDL